MCVCVCDRLGQLAIRDFTARTIHQLICHLFILDLQKGHFMWFLGTELKWPSLCRKYFNPLYCRGPAADSDH